ncbi:MAG TPA: prepilin-type N-terminal cleavage/methylation domain-containing protein [Candidatus Paceibacterota bacterium]|nr:prepilin-type N-terminal cleavage/methylation domain-containing protein [Candidatus Paceibacterota bacterium]
MEPVSALRRGFTLVEMLVVLAIITVVTTITLTGQSEFNRSLLLTDTTYTVALSLREMQTLGLSSRITGGGVQNAGYGAHFTTSPGTSYILFADTNKASPSPLATCPTGGSGTPDAKPGNCVYTSSDELFQTYNFSRGFYVSRICGKTTGSSPQTYCSDDSPALSSLDIVFVRSNTTDAVITGQRSGSVALSSAQIYISSADNSARRAICVSQLGQVSIAFNTCP